MSLVSLSDFSDVYLAERLPVIARAQPDVRSDVLAGYINDSRHIREVTNSVIKNYNPQVECTRPLTPVISELGESCPFTLIIVLYAASERSAVPVRARTGT